MRKISVEITLICAETKISRLTREKINNICAAHSGGMEDYYDFL